MDDLNELIQGFEGLTAGAKRKRYLTGSLVLSAEGLLDSDVAHWVSVGDPFVNRVFGDEKLGMPVGRMIEIHGVEGVGKSALLFHLLATVQKQGGLAVLADIESSYREDRAQQIGIDCASLLHLQLKERSDGKGLEGLEDLFFKISDVIKVADEIAPGTPVIVGVDTVSATPTRAELDGEYGDEGMALQARVLSAGLRKLYFETLKSSMAILVVVNQVRSNIGYMSYDQATGGKAIRFYSSVRLKVVRTGQVGTKGIRGFIENAKNKVGPWKRRVNYELMFDGGFTFKKP